MKKIHGAKLKSERIESVFSLKKPKEFNSIDTIFVLSQKEIISAKIVNSNEINICNYFFSYFIA